MTGMGIGNGGTQRRKGAMKSRREIPAYAGMTGGGDGYNRTEGVGMAGWGRVRLFDACPSPASEDKPDREDEELAVHPGAHPFDVQVIVPQLAARIGQRVTAYLSQPCNSWPYSKTS